MSVYIGVLLKAMAPSRETNQLYLGVDKDGRSVDIGVHVEILSFEVLLLD